MLGALPEQVSETNLAECEEVCRRYNLVYAQKENEQVGLAAAMAAWWMAVSEDTLVTFMTQGDERVRPWHLSFEGFPIASRNSAGTDSAYRMGLPMLPRGQRFRLGTRFCLPFFRT